MRTTGGSAGGAARLLCLGAGDCDRPGVRMAPSVSTQNPGRPGSWL